MLSFFHPPFFFTKQLLNFNPIFPRRQKHWAVLLSLIFFANPFDEAILRAVNRIFHFQPRQVPYSRGSNPQNRSLIPIFT